VNNLHGLRAVSLGAPLSIATAPEFFEIVSEKSRGQYNLLTACPTSPLAFGLGSGTEDEDQPRIEPCK
jgi:hypothetical protein